ncbi:MAG: phospholipase domain-containing protein [Solirubrobacteraceae bacterium]
MGAGDELRTVLPDPGTYDLSLHGPNGFFRRYAGSPDTMIMVESRSERRSRYLGLRLMADPRRGRQRFRDHERRRRPIRVHIEDAYARGRDIELHESVEVFIDTSNSGGWYDLTLTTPSDDSFTVELAGRLESGARLTSDPQLGRVAPSTRLLSGSRTYTETGRGGDGDRRPWRSPAAR